MATMAWLRKDPPGPASTGAPRDRVRAALAAPLAPLVEPMTAVRSGEWAAPLGDGLTALLTLTALKGRSYDLTYAVCCAWVPVATGSARWPRTLKQAQRHLWVGHFTIDAPERPRIITIDGDRALRRTAERTARHVLANAPAWWATVATPTGVLAEAQRQAGSGRRARSAGPRGRGYTLARLGRPEKARAALAEAVLPPDRAQHLARLDELLAQQ